MKSTHISDCLRRSTPVVASTVAQPRTKVQSSFQRFCRGVSVDGQKQLELVMVRRLKDDLGRLQGKVPQKDAHVS
jgi:hypothetical protein